MLMRVLAQIAKGGVYSNARIADSLRISEGLVEHMIEQLTNMGYIAKIDLSCDSGQCGGCSSSCDCSGVKVEMNMWQLTEKGKKAVEKM